MTTPKKLTAMAKQPKAVKAWCVPMENGDIDFEELFHHESEASERWYFLSDDGTVELPPPYPVLIAPLPPKRKAKKKGAKK